MGANFCSNMSINKTQLQSNLLQFMYGQDKKQGKIQHQQIIKLNQNFNNISLIVNDCTQKLKESKLLYKDPLMPTDKLILKSMNKQSNDKKHIQAIFLRPYRFLYNIEKGKTYKISNFQDSSPSYINVKDQVMQYFGVFLCFLASNPKIIDQIIVTQPNTYGLHVVKMNINGKQTPIFIDDYILCSNQVPVFSQPIKNMYLWPNLLQKAWFKTHGFTQKIIEKSTPDSVFEAFFNYPYKKHFLQQLNTSKKQKLVSSLLHSINNEYGYILTTKRQPQIHIGISGRKYLYLIGTFQYQKKRFYYIRNPCGNFDFRGTYDQISEDIKNLIKKYFNSIVIPQGNFILDQAEFFQQISQFSICYYSKVFKKTQFSLEIENNHQIFIQTQLKTRGNLSLCFRQQSSKKGPNVYSPITYQIFNMQTGQLVSDQQNNQACFGLHNSYFFNQVIKQLPQSKYLIRLKKKDKKKHYFGIKSTLIANFPLQIKIDIKNQQRFSELFKEYLLKNGKSILQKQKRKSGINPIQYIAFGLGDLICIYIFYVSPKQQQYKIQISFPSLTNLQLIYPQIDLLNVSVLPKSLSPSHKEEIIVFQKIDLTGQTILGNFQLEAF